MGMWRTSDLAMYLLSLHYHVQLPFRGAIQPNPAEPSYQKLYIDLTHP